MGLGESVLCSAKISCKVLLRPPGAQHSHRHIDTPKNAACYVLDFGGDHYVSVHFRPPFRRRAVYNLASLPQGLTSAVTEAAFNQLYRNESVSAGTPAVLNGPAGKPSSTRAWN